MDGGDRNGGHGREGGGLAYGSVCSGIEAATVAWGPLGWKPAWFSEIEPFPCAVLEHHYPQVPNLGDMRRIHERKAFVESDIDLLVGGTPCQSFSSLGNGGGLDDERGELAMGYLRIADVKKPRWIVWENVRRVLHRNRGRDFGAFLGKIQECGYGWAYRVLDARHFGVPQRRRRVFLVGHRAGWRAAAAALFEPKDLCGDPGKESTHESQPNSGEEAGVDCGAIGVDVYNCAVTGSIAATLTASCGVKGASGPKIMDSRGVRLMTPLECERLQGFEDGYTGVPHASRGMDNLRRKALGNSMAVPVMRWIGRRIGAVDRLLLRRDFSEAGTTMVNEARRNET
ncbi:DNA cytosine methyltransferase [Verrucomicrobiota bacterium]